MVNHLDVLAAGSLIIGASFVTGPEDDTTVDFLDLGGSIARVAYTRRSTQTAVSFVPVGSWEYRVLAEMSTATAEMSRVAYGLGMTF